MAETERLISLYQMGYTICIGVAILFFVLSVFLFFKFHIPQIFSTLTGIGVKKTIRKMEEINAKTGQLKYPEELKENKPGIRQGVVITPSGSEKTAEITTPSKKLFGRETGKNKTEKKQAKTYPIRFVIEKDLMLLHTDEVI